MGREGGGLVPAVRGRFIHSVCIALSKHFSPPFNPAHTDRNTAYTQMFCFFWLKDPHEGLTDGVVSRSKLLVQAIKVILSKMFLIIYLGHTNLD